MSSRNIIILIAAVFVGLLAVFLANSYFSGLQNSAQDEVRETRLTSVVVAGQPLAFGAALTPENVRLASWPAGSVPAGAFTTMDQALQGGRVALRSIAVGEPILADKVSGVGGRATLAALLPEDARAVAIPINDVAGVGGFVAPGDSVDIMLTRQIPGDGSAQEDKMTTVVLENVLVLGIDQLSDESKTDPVVAKTATVQVDQYGAQKLALATQLGVLSLALRNVENQTVGATKVVTNRDLGGRGLYIGARRTAAAAQGPSQASNAATTLGARNTKARRSGPTMMIVRGTEGQTYEVLDAR